MLSAARVGLSQGSKHSDHRIAGEVAAMRARITHERLNELQRRRVLRRTSTHDPVPLLIGENRQVLHRLHISPTGQRFPRAWDVDFPLGAFSAVLEALTIACQLMRVFDCVRAPNEGDGRNQSNRQDARVSHRLRRLEFEVARYLDSKRPSGRGQFNEPRHFLTPAAGPVQVRKCWAVEVSLPPFKEIGRAKRFDDLPQAIDVAFHR